jgi:hypothetical protein
MLCDWPDKLTVIFTVLLKLSSMAFILAKASAFFFVPLPTLQA